MSVVTANLGFPRIGSRRELKKALESYWSGTIAAEELLETARTLRAANWATQKAAGIAVIPSNDFSLYDQVLDTTVMLGAIPAAYRAIGEAGSLDVYFAMARGRQTGGVDVPASEMTKWFDTNYHYMVPELEPEQTFALNPAKPLGEYREAAALGHKTRPVIVGPVSWLKFAKSRTPGFDPLSLLGQVLPLYAELLAQLAAEGAEWVQIDEPAMVLDLTDDLRAAFRTAYAELAKVSGIKIMIATYFGGLEDNLDLAAGLPVAGLHVDLVRDPGQLDAVVAAVPADLVLSLGVIDGRNIWKSDLAALIERLEPVVAQRGAVQIAPSCSLLHVPIDLDLETGMDPVVTNWLAFAVQKLAELNVIAKALTPGGRAEVAEALAANAAAIADRRASPLTTNPAVRARFAAIDASMTQRAAPFATRIKAQRERLNLPPLPTTTIGSFPQTKEVREARAAHDKGALATEAYEEFLREETTRAIRWQEEIGIDVLVHGEFERNDMVQYFGEKLDGFAFMRAGWVQSYGSRYVRPPIIYGDVARPSAMTVKWWSHAQAQTEKPVKGMLTGPVNMLNWSFVRDDQPRADTCRQIALAVRDEVLDLEAAGCPIVQIDEAALREGLPLRQKNWAHYLGWAIEAFRIASGGAANHTQIHTHMCYSEFNDIIDSIADMDADVISIETSRSNMELLDSFIDYKYPNQIGPGVYDIHAPRRPSVDEMERLLLKAGERLAAEQIWVNPDCGLKTRRWEEVKPALENMVEAAKAARATLFQNA